MYVWLLSSDALHRPFRCTVIVEQLLRGEPKNAFIALAQIRNSSTYIILSGGRVDTRWWGFM